MYRLVSSAGKLTAIGVDSSKFASRVDRMQRHQRLATAALFFRNCAAQTLNRGDGPRRLFTLRRNTAGTVNIRFFFMLNLYATSKNR